MLSFIPIKKNNIKSIEKQGEYFIIEYLDGKKEKILSPIIVNAEKSSLNGNQWFWSVESEFIIYCNGEMKK